jgi:glucose-6-phosphate isomerase
MNKKVTNGGKTVKEINWEKAFTIYFDMENGLADKKPIQRRLSDMKDMYYDSEAVEDLINENPLIYEYYDLGAPEHEGDLAFGTSIVYPGKVGNEYFMTKGHFHSILDTAEVYFCLRGKGCMMMESPEGDWDVQELTPGKALYVPKRYAHRSINIGNEPLITFFAFRADAGHDYGTIESKGFRKLIVETDGKMEIINNPNWK